jgi:hypothetical protein
MALHAAIQLLVIEGCDRRLMDEGLPHYVVGCVIEILGGEGRGINCQEARVAALDGVALN